MGNNRPYDEYLNIPMTEGIILRREGGTVFTNVPHLVIHHSPDGYEFGYGGSGPSDLALNIIEALLHHLGYQGEKTRCHRGTCFSLAFTLHQDFKRQMLGVDRHGGTIDYQKAVAWVKEHMDSEPEAMLL